MVINYSKLIDTAMLNVVKEALKVASTNYDLVNGNHFYISFYTPFYGVQISDRIRLEYPEHMTIVLQHQFSELKINEDNFSVRLSFSGISEEIVIPWKSITLFSDPSTQLGIKFSYYVDEFKKSTVLSKVSLVGDDVCIANKYDVNVHDVVSDSSKIINLDKFRHQPKD